MKKITKYISASLILALLLLITACHSDLEEAQKEVVQGTFETGSASFKIVVPDYYAMSGLGNQARAIAPQTAKVRLSYKISTEWVTHGIVNLSEAEKTAIPNAPEGFAGSVYECSFEKVPSRKYASGELKIELLDSSDNVISEGTNDNAVTITMGKTTQAAFYTIPTRSDSDAGSLSAGEMEFLKKEFDSETACTLSISVTEGYNYPDLVIFNENGTFEKYISVSAANKDIDCSEYVGTTKYLGFWSVVETSYTVSFVYGGSSSISYSIGDVLLNDGTIVAYNPELNYTDAQKQNAVGIVYGLKENGEPMGYLGLYNSVGGKNSGTYIWAKDGTTGYNTNFTGIQSDGFGENITGDTDGSDNWEYICSVDPEGTANAAVNYPAFNYVNNYASTFGLAGDYAEGWYMPTFAELYYVFQAKDVLNSVLEELGGIQISSNNNDFYWTSSQCDDYDKSVWLVYAHGPTGTSEKSYNNIYFHARVLCVRSFNEFGADIIYKTSLETVESIKARYNRESHNVNVSWKNPAASGFAYAVLSYSKGGISVESDIQITNERYLINNVTIDGDEYAFTVYVVDSAGNKSPSVTATVTPAMYYIGDVLLNDGSIIDAHDLNFTDEQKSMAVGVVYGLKENGEPMGYLGLYNSDGEKKNTRGGYRWAQLDTTGAKTKFEGIICSLVPNYSYLPIESISGFTGDTDGSDNWAYICSIDQEGTADAASNYPAFDYVNKYASKFGLTGEYAKGWYMPSLAELYFIYKNIDVLNSVLKALGGQALFGTFYWTSSQLSFDIYQAWNISKSEIGIIVDGMQKSEYEHVCCVRAFE